MHKEAWLHREVSARDKKGKYVFDTFTKFYKENVIKENLGITEGKRKSNKTYKRLADIARKVNTRKE